MFTMGKKHPCYECPFRHPGCHAECDWYKDVATDKAEYYKEASRQRLLNEYRTDEISKNIKIKQRNH